MANWLENAEQESFGKKSKNRRDAGFLDRKTRIEKNYEANKKEYNNFIKTLNELIGRVNRLPLKQKQPFGNIDLKFKDSKFNNQLNIYSSSKRYEKQIFKKTFYRLLEGAFTRLFVPSHFKHVRIVYVSVSSQSGKIGLEVKETALLKTKAIVDKELVKKHNKYSDKNRFHEYFHYNIDKLNKDLAMQIVDWLAFKNELKDLLFIN